MRMLCVCMCTCTCLCVCCLCSDGEAVESLNELRLTAEDFTVKAIIGRGHFGEVSIRVHMYVHV